MTDRELLEKAAKAAGYPIHSDAWACGPSSAEPKLYMGSNGPVWNPLTDDGDALRLALRLKLRIDYVGDQAIVQGVMQPGMTAEESARRAIVRAAAAMVGQQ